MAAARHPGGRLAALGTGIAVLVAYTAGAMVCLLHSWAHPTTVMLAAGSGDEGQTAWYLRYVPWAILHGHDPLVTSVANWPFGLNLVDQTSVLALGLVASPVSLAFGPAVAYTACTTAAFALSAGAGYLLCRRYVAWRPAAFVGGLLYGFSPYMVGQASHLNLCFVPIPPLVLLVLDDLVVRRAHRARTDGLALAAAVVVQFFLSTEILATTVLFSLLTVVVLSVRHPDEITRRVGRVAAGLAWAAGASLVVLAWPIEVLLRGPQHITGSVAGFKDYQASLLSPVLPTSNQVIGTHHLTHLGDLLLAGNMSEDDGYLGVTLLAIALVAVLAVRARTDGGGRAGAVRVGALMALLAFLLSMGTRFHLGLPGHTPLATMALPSAWISHVPLLDQAFPNRYALYVTLYLAIVLAGAVDALRDWLLARPGRAGAAHLPPGRVRGCSTVPVVVAVVALLPLLPAWPMAFESPLATPPYFTGPGVHAVAGHVALVYPYPEVSDAQAQYWQAAAGMRFTMPGGYYLLPALGGGSETGEQTLVATTLTALRLGPAPTRTPVLRAALRTQLRSWDVSALVVAGGSEPVGFFTWLTGRPPDAATGGVVEWYHETWGGP